MHIWQNRDTSFQNMEAPMDRLEAMSLVLAVAEAGSLSAAARAQKVPLATVSRKVSELEAHLQTKLFQPLEPRACADGRGALLHRCREAGSSPMWRKPSAPPRASTRHRAAA
jgi:hypothetical protein